MTTSLPTTRLGRTCITPAGAGRPMGTQPELTTALTAPGRGGAVTVRVGDGVWRGVYRCAGPAAAWAMRVATVSGCDT